MSNHLPCKGIYCVCKINWNLRIIIQIIWLILAKFALVKKKKVTFTSVDEFKQHDSIVGPRAGCDPSHLAIMSLEDVISLLDS